RGVHFDADMVTVRIARRGEAQRFAIAEADFQYQRRAAPEHRVEVAPGAPVVKPETRPQFIERALLGLGEAALAQDEAADRAAAGFDGIGLGRSLAGVHPTSPSSGEEALA